MNETEIRKYAVLMKELGLTGLEITEDNKVVRLERNVSSEAKGPAVTPVPDTDAAAFASNNNTNDISVKSPLVGVFYAAPAENAEPYIAVGYHIKKGQTLCIVEAMKLMNEILAEEDGVVSQICVTNGQVVEFGTELFRIRR